MVFYYYLINQMENNKINVLELIDFVRKLNKLSANNDD